jgi:hypothetical protein
VAGGHTDQRFQINGAQYVYFCGLDSVVHEYTYGNNGDFNWVDNKLPATTKGYCNGDNGSTSIAAVATSPNNQRHVYYLAASTSTVTDPVRQLYFNGSKWVNQPFSSLVKESKVAVKGAYISAVTINNNQYVFFVGQKGVIYMYSYVDDWAITNLSEAATAPHASDQIDSTGVVAFVVPGTRKIEIYYASGSTNDVNQLTFANNAWSDEDLTARTGGSGPNASSQMTALSTPGNFHVYLNEGDGMSQMYFNGSDWVNQGLPSVPVSQTGTASFAISNDQYVYYISTN